MTEFFNVLPPDDARQLLFDHLTWRTEGEIVATEDVQERVTYEDIYASEALPAFRRSTMDGYAVRAADTFGASDTLPAILSVVGEVNMGEAANVSLAPYQAAVVHTGGMIPDTANAVVQIEHTQSATANTRMTPYGEIEVMKAVAVGQNVLQIGEDVTIGDKVLPQGHLIRPQDIGGLLALGIVKIPVARSPRVAILGTGDEVIHPQQEPSPGEIRDINSYTVAGQCRIGGGIPHLLGIIPDDAEALEEAAQNALNNYDMVVFSAGSSVSTRDMTATIIDALGDPGVLLHGVATRPGKPTILGVVEGKPILGLPGNPVSAMVQFSMFGIPAIHQMQGLQSAPRRGIVWARLSTNISSETGREDYVPSRLQDSSDGLIATPVFGKSNLIYTLVNADGLLKVPLNKGGLTVGEWVEVQLF
jgi:molybdopterin molybdotransferase